MNLNPTDSPHPDSQTSPPGSVLPSGEQVGGGRRQPSPPPLQTPTRLRSKVKATEHDTGLVRHAGTRRERLLDDVLPVLPEGSSDNLNSKPEIGCASDLFADIPSQSPFLTCRTQSAVKDVTVHQAANAIPSAAVHAMFHSDVPDPRGLATEPGPCPPLDREMLPTAGIVDAAPATGLPQPPVRTQLRFEKQIGLPAPRVPELPSLLDLKEVLAEVQSQTAADSVDRPSSCIAHPPSLEGPSDLTPRTGPSNSLGALMEATSLEDESYDLTPQAGPSKASASILVFNGVVEDHTEIEFPDIDRPETPTPQSRSARGAYHSCLDAETLGTGTGTENENTDLATVLGRTPASAKAIMDEAFQGVQKELSDVAARVGLPFQQVLNRFSQQFSRTCATNYWNVYQKYHAANKDAEVARLGNINVAQEGPVQIMKSCYKLFQEAHPDTWKEILIKFEDLYIAMSDGGKTMGHRQSLFFRLAENHCHAFMGMSKAHGFEVLMMIAGSVVHNDGPLALLFTTPGAENFCQERCRASESDMLAHFKAHIYNKVSLENAAITLPNGPSMEASKQSARSGECSKLVPESGGSSTRVAESGESSKQARASGPSLNPSAESGDSSKQARASGQSLKPSKEVDDTDEVEIVEMHEMEDHSRVRHAFVVALTKVGCRWASGKLFPWKALPTKLASSGVVCYNFPDKVPFPGEERQRSKGGSKGICDLSIGDCSILIAAFNDWSEDKIRFEKNVAWIGDLRAGRLPVIVGAPPKYESPHGFAKRMFVGGFFDRTGPPRKLVDSTAKARTRVKRTRLPAASASETVTITDSDRDLPVRKGKGKDTIVIADSEDDEGRARESKTGLPIDVGKDSDDVQEVPPAALKKRRLPERKGRPRKVRETSITIADEVKEVRDISSPSGSEFLPEKDKEKSTDVASDADEEVSSNDADISDQLDMPISRKRKALGAGGSHRPAKKRGVVEASRPSSIASKDKGKEPERVAMKGPNVVMNDAEASSRERPKPRLVTKKTLGETDTNRVGMDPFCRRKPLVCPPVSGQANVGEPQDLGNASSGAQDVAPVAALANESVDCATVPTQVPAPAQPQGTTPSNEGGVQIVVSPAVVSTLAVSAVTDAPAVAHREDKDKVAVGSGLSSQHSTNGPPVVHASAQNIGAGSSQDHLPFPAGWFGPQGPGPRFQGYPGPPFFGPYGGWGMFPNVDHTRQEGVAVPQSGRDGGSPYDLARLYFGGQPFVFPNGYPTNMSNLPGTSEVGHGAHDGDSGNNAN